MVYRFTMDRLEIEPAEFEALSESVSDDIAGRRDRRTGSHRR